MKDEQKLDNLIFLIFLIPGTPKDIITYFAGLTPVKFSHFLVITTVARIPSVITSTLAGEQADPAGFRIGLLDLCDYDRLQRRRAAALPRGDEKTPAESAGRDQRKRKQAKTKKGKTAFVPSEGYNHESQRLNPRL